MTDLSLHQHRCQLTSSDLRLLLLLLLLLLHLGSRAVEGVEGIVGGGGADVDEVGIAGGGRGMGSAEHGMLTSALDASLLRLRCAKLHLFELVHRRRELLH